MADRSVADLVGEWQTGAFIVVVTVLSGVVSALVLRSLEVPYGRAIGFVGGAALAFLAISYLLYGR